jgi:hypothetical protein
MHCTVANVRIDGFIHSIGHQMVYAMRTTTGKSMQPAPMSKDDRFFCNCHNPINALMYDSVRVGTWTRC